jgi:hypothetical protein
MLLRSKQKRALIEADIMKYWIYAIGEVCLVAIGLLIALQVDNWSNEQDNRALEQQYYESMLAQLVKDKDALVTTIEEAQYLSDRFDLAISIIDKNDREQSALLGAITIELKDYADFRQKSSIFQTLVNSGEIKHIRNKEIVSTFQELESMYSYIERLEGVHEQAVMTLIADQLIEIIQIQPLEVKQPEALYGYVLKNTFMLIRGLNVETGSVYQQTAQDIGSAITMIEQELEINNQE